jgi:hypothetical protein
MRNLITGGFWLQGGHSVGSFCKSSKGVDRTSHQVQSCPLLTYPMATISLVQQEYYSVWSIGYVLLSTHLDLAPARSCVCVALHPKARVVRFARVWLSLGCQVGSHLYPLIVYFGFLSINFEIKIYTSKAKKTTSGT